ncbi:MAG: helix-turn-helix transcriptional regulator [Alphaproteobacteria bacterium]|nr:helix-turn-helix transcriptional regulator [Alphaproteobacteria bacterium]
MITIEQCRGARGVLGWTQQDLADASGLSKTAINNFEKGHSDIKAESLRAIRMAFESADIEFLERDGLRRRSEHVSILRGADALDRLFDDMNEVLRKGGGDVLIANVASDVTARLSPKTLLAHTETLEKYKITQRILSAPGEVGALGAMQESVSVLSGHSQACFSTFIYGTKVAFELWDQAMIVIISSAEAQQAERRRFEYLWNLSGADQKANVLRKDAL